MSKLHKYHGAAHFRQRLVLATLSGCSIRIEDIRINADEPGLRDYEACFLRLLDRITNGSRIEIDHSGTAVLYRPGLLTGGSGLEHDCGVGRSIGYFLESLVCVAPFCKQPLHITLTGITNENTDPSADIIRTATLPLLKPFGVDVDSMKLKIIKRGAPPLGGGEVVLSCPVVKTLHPVNLLSPGLVKRIRGIAYVTRMSPQTANRIVTAARGVLNHAIPDVYIYADHYRGPESGKSPGFGLSLVAESTTSVLLSAELVAKPGDTPEDVGESAARLLLDEIARGGCVDSVNQSIMLLYMVLCTEDVSRVLLGQLTPHTIAFLRHIRDMFGVTFKIEVAKDGESVLLTCKGVGFSNISKRVQ